MTATNITPGETNFLRISNAINKNADEVDASLKIANNLSDVADVATAFGNIKQAASDTATGVVELATIEETLTGTDTSRAVTPADAAALVGANAQPSSDIDALYAGINSLQYSVQKLLNRPVLIDYGKGNQFRDSYDTTTYIAVSTNTDTATVPGSVRPSITGSPSAISGSTGTTIGDLGASNATSAFAFDGTTSATATGGSIAFSTTPTGVSRWIGKNVASSPAAIFQVIVHGSSNQGYAFVSPSTSVNPPIIVQLRGKNGSAPVSALDGILLGSTTFTDGTTTSAKTILSNDITTTWDYRWVAIQQTGGLSLILMLAEVVFYSPPTPNNMTLNSVLVWTAPKTINSAIVTAEIEYTSAPTLNTDILFDVSSDNGSHWTTLVMATSGTSPDPHKKTIQSPVTTISNAAVTAKYRVRTANNVMVQLNSIEYTMRYT